VPEPSLVLSVELQDRKAILKIQDNGLPISDDLPSDPFREGVTKYRESCGGTGVGLTIVRDIVASHGGEWPLTEHRDGAQRRLAGLTFSLILPINRGFEA